MFEKRLSQIAELLLDSNREESVTLRISKTGWKIFDVDGVSTTISIDGEITSQASFPAEYRELDEKQFLFGNGPAFDGYSSLEPVVARDLSSKPDTETWPIFAPIAVNQKIRGVISYPLRIGNAKLGVLTTYQKSKISFSQDEYLDGLLFSTLASSFIVEQLAQINDQKADQMLGPTFTEQTHIHLAAGKIAEKMNVSIVEAMVRLRAYAFKEDMTIVELSKLIVEGKIELES